MNDAAHLESNHFKEEREAKAAQWKTLGFAPYGLGFSVNALAQELLRDYGDRSAQELEAAPPGPFAVAGRLMSIRDFGKAAFLVIADRSGAIQVYVKSAQVSPETFAAYKLLDTGDIVGVRGTLFKSKTGELTIAAQELMPLTKALRPIPGKYAKGDDEEARAWAERQALAQVEERYRHRYLDLISNPRVQEIFRKRSRLIRYIRAFFDSRDFLEVETPMMHALVTGATARPFTTHHNALDIPLFLRIAPELYLKRLVVGGFHRVYELNRCFRNEGISTRHNPEFTMLELYQAFATYEDLMALTEELFRGAANELVGSLQVTYGEAVIDFARPWERLTMKEAIQRHAPDLAHADLDDVELLRRLCAKASPEGGFGELDQGLLLTHLFETYAEPKLIQPTFITQFPLSVSPLARASDTIPGFADRFELFCAGREIANGFNELNDPVDQAGRFRAQNEAKARGATETMDYDADYIRALEYGLPPTAGEGIGIDRLTMLLTDTHSIREVLLFPLLRPLS